MWIRLNSTLCSILSSIRVPESRNYVLDQSISFELQLYFSSNDFEYAGYDLLTRYRRTESMLPTIVILSMECWNWSLCIPQSQESIWNVNFWFFWSTCLYRLLRYALTEVKVSLIDKSNSLTYLQGTISAGQGNWVQELRRTIKVYGSTEQSNGYYIMC